VETTALSVTLIINRDRVEIPASVVRDILTQLRGPMTDKEFVELWMRALWGNLRDARIEELSPERVVLVEKGGMRSLGVRIPRSVYERLIAEAERRGMKPSSLAREFIIKALEE